MCDTVPVLRKKVPSSYVMDCKKNIPQTKESLTSRKRMSDKGSAESLSDPIQ